MARRWNTRAHFLGVALASPVTSSAQMRLSSFIGGMAIQRGVQEPAWDAAARSAAAGREGGARRTGVASGPSFVHGANKVPLAVESLAESRPPPMREGKDVAGGSRAATAVSETSRRA